jgi:hypothetical protein
MQLSCLQSLNQLLATPGKELRFQLLRKATGNSAAGASSDNGTIIVKADVRDGATATTAAYTGGDLTNPDSRPASAGGADDDGRFEL